MWVYNILNYKFLCQCWQEVSSILKTCIIYIGIPASPNWTAFFCLNNALNYRCLLKDLSWSYFTFIRLHAPFYGCLRFLLFWQKWHLTLIVKLKRKKGRNLKQPEKDTFLKLSKSDPGDLWPMIHLIRVVRHDLTNKITENKERPKYTCDQKILTKGELQSNIQDQ